MYVRIKVNATYRIKRAILTKAGIELEVQNLGGITLSHLPIVCIVVVIIMNVRGSGTITLLALIVAVFDNSVLSWLPSVPPV
jgi:hypothetical protein